MIRIRNRLYTNIDTKSSILCNINIEKILEDNLLLITDYYNKNNQNKEFINNRHDQSVFSIIRKIHGSIVISDETYFKERFNSKIAQKFPFWATRKK